MGVIQQHHSMQHSLLADGFAWCLNVSSAVTIVFVNKVLMDPKKGYAFTYGEHTSSCSACMRCMKPATSC